jgi:hypothetical protein
LPAGASCRTVASATHSVQTFTDTGQTVTVDSTCRLNGTADVNCDGTFNDSVGGPGTMSQNSRFASRADIVDETAVNPPRTLSSGTTTVMTVNGVPFTITTTNTFDGQRRLTSTQSNGGVGIGTISSTTTYTAWDSSGRPTAGTLALSPGGTFSVSIAYDAGNRTATRNSGLNVCTQTHDANGNITREVCTGTSPSTTTVTINSTQQICK